MIHRLHQILRSIGVSRINEISNYDDLPIHVFQAIRPNALHLKVDSGKGFSRQAAFLSAAVESIERFAAENISNKIHYVRTKQLPDDLASTYSSHHISNTVIPVLKGVDIISGTKCFIPYSLCSYDVFNPLCLSPRFSNGTTGLGAHSSFKLAVLSGILEIIERDAIASNNIIPFTLPNSGRLQFLLDSIFDKVPSLQFTRYSSPNGLFVIEVRCNENSINGGFVSFGTGFCLVSALEDALAEAMQTWILRLAASRDDWSYSLNSYRTSPHSLKILPQSSSTENITQKIHNFPLSNQKYSLQNLQRLLSHFADNHIRIYAVNLHTKINISPIWVVKVILPSASPLRQGPMLTGLPIQPL